MLELSMMHDMIWCYGGTGSVYLGYLGAMALRLPVYKSSLVQICNALPSEYREAIYKTIHVTYFES